MKKVIKTALVVLGCSLAFNAAADSRVDAVYKCKLKDDKEMSEVHTANTAWLAHIKEATDVSVNSGTATAIVGGFEGFYFVDSYPSLSAWASVQEYLDSDAGEAAIEEITNQFDDLFECSENNLYKFTSN